MVETYPNDAIEQYSSNSTLEPGLGGIQGRIANLGDYWEERQVYIFVAQFYGDPEGEGSFILEPSIFPKALIGKDGQFLVQNLPPRLYVLIAGPNAEIGLIVKNGDRALIVEVIIDEILDLEIVRVAP